MESERYDADCNKTKTVIHVKTIDDVLIKLREHEVQTTSKYVLTDSCRKFSLEKIELTDKLKLHWDDDQTPYFHFGTRTYDCHQGKDTNVYQKEKYAQWRDKKAQEDHCFIKRYKKAQLTKKLNCPAMVQVTRVLKIFEHKLTGLSCKSAKDKMSRLIKKKITEGASIGEEMFVIKFPSQEDHKYHLQGANAAVIEPVDERVKDHIAALVRRGERNPIVVSKLIQIFVRQELQENDEHRRRFYPDLKTVRQIISCAKGKLKTSPIDQENTESMLKKFDTTKHNVFFRPYTIKNSDDEDDNSSDEDKPEENNLLFVYQSQEMSHLYRTYGSNTLLLDATYRTCKYALPLYFVVVETNVNYQIVGVLITQFETKKAITEGLTILKSWNPDIFPKYGMVDYAAEEIGSLEAVFPSIKVFICTFHREQAWTRWLSKGSNSSIPKQEALNLLREVANATSEEEVEAALQKLRSWRVYKNTHFKTYFESTWFKEINRWASAYKPLDMHINTNNGVERLNKELKYNHLEGFKNCSLSELIDVILLRFLPERYAKYVSENLLMTPQSRKYDVSIPHYLHGRPKWLIDHVMSRLALVTKSHAKKVMEMDEGVFSVPSMSSDSVEYSVIFNISRKWCSCTCKDFCKERLICKHILLVGLQYPNWNLDQIHQWLLSDPVFVYDKTLITEEPSQIVAQIVENPSSSDNGNSLCGYGNIPVRGSLRKHLINDCNSTMRSIQSALWYVEEEKLQHFSTSLKELFAEISSSISVDTSSGLPVDPNPEKIRKRYCSTRKITFSVADSIEDGSESPKQPKKKFKKLCLNRRKKAFSGRVGLVADMMKSTSQVAVSSILSSTSDSVDSLVAV